MSNNGIDKQTNSSLLSLTTTTLDNTTLNGLNTALHFCALYDKVECMKLLLRSGANANLKNSNNKTAMDIAQDLGHRQCQELVSVFSIFCIFFSLIFLFNFSAAKCC